MTEENKKSDDNINDDEFKKLLDKEDLKIPQAKDTVKGKVVSASSSEVRLDIDGVLIGVVRGPELYEEAEEYANLKPGDEVEATVIEEDNENGELELSFRYAGQEKAWISLKDAFENKKTIKIKVVEANKGGLLVRYKQIPGFLPVSQLAPDNYPRVSGGDKGKILEKLKLFIGKDFEVQVIALEENEDKIIFSEKNIWSEKQKDVIAKYNVGTKVKGKITAVTNFGVFISFDEGMEGLIHISELAWQRIDNPSDLYKVGDELEAEVISVDGPKIFLSAKKLMEDPWQKASKKYKAGQIVKGKILKINPFGLFVKLDNDIHGLAHVSQLGLAPGQKIEEVFKSQEETEFEIMSIEPEEHRLGLKVYKEEKGAKKDKKAEKEEIKKDDKNKDDEKKFEESVEKEEAKKDAKSNDEEKDNSKKEEDKETKDVNTEEKQEEKVEKKEENKEEENKES